LILDDDTMVRQLLTEILAERGYRVFEAGNGKEAVSKIENTAIDLVITDLVMPEQDGLETIRLLHRRHPALRIMAVSGYQSGAYLRCAELFGAHATLKKPFSIDAVLETVERLLRSA
jgi:CheY-like chemotaxis protein